MSELAKSFGARVKALRNGRGWTQAQLADAMRVSDEWVRKIERGLNNPSFATIEALATALDVVPAELFVTADGGELSVLVERAGKLSPAQVAWLLEAADLAARLPKG
jgi:transcriptional regulator with XRE-family HTH domain